MARPGGITMVVTSGGNPEMALADDQLALTLPEHPITAWCTPAVNRTLACEMPGRRQRRGQPLVTAHLTDKTSPMR
jgi:hypothetical protein